MRAISQDTATKHPELVLGYIVWYSVPDVPISLIRLKRAWQDAGLDKTPLSRTKTRVANAFQRAVRSLAGTVRNDPEVDPKTGWTIVTTTDTDVRLLKDDPDEIIYQVSRVTRDLKGQIINYPPAVRIRFDKATEEASHQSLGGKGITPADVYAIMDLFNDEFEKAGKTVPGRKVRELIRRYLSDDYDERDNLWGLSGENMRGKAGGVYFVPARHEQTLNDIGTMLWKLWQNTPDKRGRPVQASLWKFPIADGEAERNMVRDAQIANALEDAKIVMFDVGTLLRDDRKRAVRDDVRKKAWRKLERAQWRAAEYAKILGDKQSQAQDALDGMERQLRRLYPGGR
jgi:hypothetical protein